MNLMVGSTKRCVARILCIAHNTVGQEKVREVTCKASPAANPTTTFLMATSSTVPVKWQCCSSFLRGRKTNEFLSYFLQLKANWSASPVHSFKCHAEESHISSVMKTSPARPFGCMQFTQRKLTRA